MADVQSNAADTGHVRQQHCSSQVMKPSTVVVVIPDVLLEGRAEDVSLSMKDPATTCVSTTYYYSSLTTIIQ